MLADAEVQVSTAVVPRLERARAFPLQVGLGGGRQVGRPAHQAGQARADGVQHLSAGVARGDALLVGGEGRQVLVPAVRQLALAQEVEGLSLVRVLLGVAAEHVLPRLALRTAAGGHRLCEPLLDPVGYEEAGVLRPAVGLLGLLDVLRLAQRLAVRLARAGHGRAVADGGVHHDEGRPIGGGLEALQRLADGRRVVGVLDVDHLPAVRLEALARILCEGEFGVALDGDVVAVVDPAEVRQGEVAGEGRRLAGHALLHAAVAADHVDVVVEQAEVVLVEPLRQRLGRDRHADRVGAALAQRAGGRLHASRQAVTPGGRASWSRAGGRP